MGIKTNPSHMGELVLNESITFSQHTKLRMHFIYNKIHHIETNMLQSYV